MKNDDIYPGPSIYIKIESGMQPEVAAMNREINESVTYMAASDISLIVRHGVRAQVEDDVAWQFTSTPLHRSINYWE